MNSKPKISIIVPIYNAGEHLQKCLDTLVNQTLREIEIILVLDKPTDGSDKVAKEYAAKDSRIVILENEENLHIGYSRNKGIVQAKGEFIGFSDHDDYRDLTMYETLYNHAKQNDADIVLSVPAYVENGKTRVKNFVNEQDTNLKEVVLNDLISFGGESLSSATFVLITNNIYKRELINQHKIRFVNTRTHTPEDVLFQIESIAKSNNLSVINKPLYYHIFHSDNEGGTYSYIGYKRRGEGINKLYEWLKKENLFLKYEHQFYQGVVKQFTYSLAGAFLPGYKFLKFIKAAKYLRKFPFTKTAFHAYTQPLNKKGLHNRIFRKMIELSMKV